MALAVALGRQCLHRVNKALASQSPRQWHPAFENLNGETEGSRTSAKQLWHSYMDLTDTSSNGIGDGIWERNVAPPPSGNSILWGHLLDLGITP